MPTKSKSRTTKRARMPARTERLVHLGDRFLLAIQRTTDMVLGHPTTQPVLVATGPD